MPEHSHDLQEHQHTAFENEKIKADKLQVFQDYLDAYWQDVLRAERAIAKGEEGGLEMRKYTNRTFTLDAKIDYIDWIRYSITAGVIGANASLNINFREDKLEEIEKVIKEGEEYTLKIRVTDIFSTGLKELHFIVICELLI